MRFDGYYILSDLLDEPNLRARSDQWAMLELKHWLLGIPRSYSAGMESASTHYRVCLVFFSIAGAIYRLSLSFGIASLVIALYSSWHLAWIGKLVALVILFTWWCIPVFTLGSSNPIDSELVAAVPTGSPCSLGSSDDLRRSISVPRILDGLAAA